MVGGMSSKDAIKIYTKILGIINSRDDIKLETFCIGVHSSTYVNSREESEAEEDTMIEFGMVTLSIIRYIVIFKYEIFFSWLT